jgi:hypothetical protein
LALIHWHDFGAQLKQCFFLNSIQDYNQAMAKLSPLAAVTESTRIQKVALTYMTLKHRG